MLSVIENSIREICKTDENRQKLLEIALGVDATVARAVFEQRTIARADGSSGSSVDPSAPNPVADNTAANAPTPTVDPDVLAAIVTALVASPDFVKAVTDICMSMDAAEPADLTNAAPVMNSIDITNAITAAIKPLATKLDSIERGLLSADEAAILEAAGSAKMITGRDLITRAKKIDPANPPAPASLADRAAAQMARMTSPAK